jgi:ABC-type transport system involved in multi-copper enzyme maturation permease subunit
LLSTDRNPDWNPPVMTFLPVVDRELRVASRRRWSYWGRTLAAGVALLVVVWFALVESRLSLNRFGQQLFATTSFLAAVFAVLAGVVYSADSLAEERREGTLGLLFLTDLKGYDVLFGKMAASSLGSIFHLVACLPIMAIAILMGGVSAGEYLRMVALLLNTLMCSLSLGMLASTLTADSKRAAATTLIFVLGLCALMPALGGIAYWLGWKFDLDPNTRERVFETGFAWGSPVVGFFHAFDSEFGSKPRLFHLPMAFVFGVGVTALAVSAFRLPRLWQEKGATETRRGLRSWIEHRRWPDAPSRTRWRERLLEESPMVWLTGRYWMRPITVWIFLGVVAAIFLLIGLEVGKHWFEAPTFVITSMLVHLCLKAWMASEAPRQFHEDRRSGAMELLLSTPLTVDDFLHGRMRALRHQFEWPIVVVLFVDLVFLVKGIDWNRDSDASDWAVFWICRMVLFLADAYTMAWVGQWIGMKTAGNRTTIHVLWRVLGVPWGISFVVMTFAGMIALGGGGGILSDLGFKVMLIAWCLLCLANNFVWRGLAETELRTAFRVLALGRPGEKKAVSPA